MLTGKTRAGPDTMKADIQCLAFSLQHRLSVREVERNLCNGGNWHGKWQTPSLTTRWVQRQVTNTQSVIPTAKCGSVSLKHTATAARIPQAI